MPRGKSLLKMLLGNQEILLHCHGREGVRVRVDVGDAISSGMGAPPPRKVYMLQITLE